MLIMKSILTQTYSLAMSNINFDNMDWSSFVHFLG